jgi:hypothetical protein
MTLYVPEDRRLLDRLAPATQGPVPRFPHDAPGPGAYVPSSPFTRRTAIFGLRASPPHSPFRIRYSPFGILHVPQRGTTRKKSACEMNPFPSHA